ncbi:hypothetical protein MMC10_007515 [Thelotrema lepadinum]|nr:hypothetical protein [Thelotrema lepadinum]
MDKNQKIKNRNDELQKMKFALDWKTRQYKNPKAQMRVVYSTSTTNKKVYTEEEDRFLLYQLHKHGVVGDEIYETIRYEIGSSTLFRWDWLILTRTPAELRSRCTTLLKAVTMEYESFVKSEKMAAEGEGKKEGKTESSIKQEAGVKQEPSIKQETGSKRRASIKGEAGIKQEPSIKQEV